MNRSEQKRIAKRFTRENRKEKGKNREVERVARNEEIRQARERCSSCRIAGMVNTLQAFAEAGSG